MKILREWGQEPFRRGLETLKEDLETQGLLRERLETPKGAEGRASCSHLPGQEQSDRKPEEVPRQLSCGRFMCEGGDVTSPHSCLCLKSSVWEDSGVQGTVKVC